MKYEEYLKLIKDIKSKGQLTDGVIIFIVGMITCDVRNLNIDWKEAQELMKIVGFDFDKFGAIGELVVFGDIVDFKGQRIDYTKEELMGGR